MIKFFDRVFSRHRRSGTYIPICREVAPGDEYFPSSSGGGIHHVGRRRVSSSSVDRWRIHDFQPLHSDEAVLLLVELLMISPEVAMAETRHCNGPYICLSWLRDIYQRICQTQHWTAAARIFCIFWVALFLLIRVQPMFMLCS